MFKLNNSIASTDTTLLSKVLLNNKEYYSFPAIILKQGVLNNSFYSGDEILKSVNSWNGKPITVDHPSSNGTRISANSPDMENSVVIGKVFNSRFENETLKCDLYVDIDKVKQLKQDALLDKLNKNEMLEVSTGLYTRTLMKNGSFNGKDYSTIEIDYKPDHLAILTEDKGACCIEDGCGGLRNNYNNNNNDNNTKVNNNNLKENKHMSTIENHNENKIPDVTESQIRNSNLFVLTLNQEVKQAISKYEEDKKASGHLLTDTDKAEYETLKDNQRKEKEITINKVKSLFPMISDDKFEAMDLDTLKALSESSNQDNDGDDINIVKDDAKTVRYVANAANKAPSQGDKEQNKPVLSKRVMSISDTIL